MAGGDASQVPAALDPSWINRKLEAIEQWQREMPADLMRSVAALVSQANVPMSFHEITTSIPVIATDPLLSATVTVPAGYNSAMAMIAVTGILDLSFASGSKVYQGAIEVASEGRAYSSNQISAPGGVVTISAIEMFQVSELDIVPTLTFKALTSTISSTTVTGEIRLNGLVVFYRA